MNPLFVVTIFIADNDNIESFKKQLTILLNTSQHGFRIALATNSEEIYNYGKGLFNSLLRVYLPNNLEECNDHGNEAIRFRYAFAKISTLRLLAIGNCSSELYMQEYSHIILIDADSFFPSDDLGVFKNGCFYGVNYREEHYSSLSALIPLFSSRMQINHNFLADYWINTGFLAIPIEAIRALNFNCQNYLSICKVTSKEIVKAVNHYSDEIVFNFAIGTLLLDKLNRYDFTLVSSPQKHKPAFLWTIPIQSRKITLINYLKTPCHVHIPDIKYNKKKLDLYVFLSNISLISKSAGRIVIITVFNVQILWNKLLRPLLSGIKRMKLQRIF